MATSVWLQTYFHFSSPFFFLSMESYLGQMLMKSRERVIFIYNSGESYYSLSKIVPIWIYNSKNALIALFFW